jgi:hypothetical protein
LVIGAAAIRQILELSPLDIDASGLAGIPPSDDLGDEAAIGVKIIEVGRPAHEKGVFDCAFEMTVRPFDGTVLVGDAGIVAGRRHPITGA